MDIKAAVEHLSIGDSLDIKKLITTMFKDEMLETIYESIKDTSK